MRREVKIFEDARVGMIAYGLDTVPVEGYFVSLYDHDGEYIRGSDTRENMCLDGADTVMTRGELADFLARYEEVPEIDIERIKAGLPVGSETGP